MTYQNDVSRIEHIREAIGLIGRWLAGSDYAAFAADEQLQSAVAYRVQVIGEAAARLSPGLRSRHPGLPWRSVIAMRNIIAHEYARLDPVLLWGAAAIELPAFAQQIEPIRETETEQP